MIGNGAIERRASAEHKVNLVNSLTTVLVFFWNNEYFLHRSS